MSPQDPPQPTAGDPVRPGSDDLTRPSTSDLELPETDGPEQDEAGSVGRPDTVHPGWPAGPAGSGPQPDPDRLSAQQTAQPVATEPAGPIENLRPAAVPLPPSTPIPPSTPVADRNQRRRARAIRKAAGRQARFAAARQPGRPRAVTVLLGVLLLVVAGSVLVAQISDARPHPGMVLVTVMIAVGALMIVGSRRD